MRLYINKVRIRKRILYPAAMIIRGFTSPLVFIVAMQFILLYFGEMVHGLVINSYSSGASSSVRSISGLSVSNLGAFLAIYSALPHFANAKSIRNGKEVEDNVTISVMPNTTLSSTPLPLITNQTFIVNSTQEGNSSSIVFSSRTLITSEEDNATTLTPSVEMEMNLDYSSEELRKNRREKRKGMNRLKRQMGIAAEIALIAPALQTMGCIPKFFCGMNTKPPTKESSAINDLAYLIKFAMLDDDDVDVEDQLFPDKVQNNRGKDGLGLTRIKEDLILENMAEEELIKEDPGNLPFVWKDMEHRIKTKTKPGSKLRIDDLMDEIIVEPEQTAVGSIFTGIKSVLRIGRSVDHVLSRVEGQANESSQATPRSGRSERVVGRMGNTAENVQMFRRRRLQLKKRPFWATPQFRQDMELAERIGKTEQDEQKCSTTFSVCPYTVHEMMEIVHGGYSKKRKQMKKKNKPQWYVNADGPPADSSEEISTKDGSNKPVRDPENLITTTTEKTHWSPNDPENQIFYSIFPHKAVEQGMTTVRTTKRPASSAKPKQKDRHETVYDIGPRPNREHRKPPLHIQGHAEYENENENDDEMSLENKPEHLDMMIHNKNNPHFHQQPPQKTSWFSFGQKGNQRPQQGPHHRPPGRRPPHGMGRPQQNPNVGPSGFDLGFSREEEENNKSGNDDGDLDGSSEENGQDKKRKKKKDGSSSDSAEDEDDNGRSSEEKSSADERPASSTPAPTPPQDTVIQLPPELNAKDPNIHIYGLHLIENGGDLAPTGLPQQPQSLQPLQPFIIEEPKPKGPISLPRPKYKIVKERRQKKKRRRLIPAAAPSPVYTQQPQQQVQTQAPKQSNPSKKEDKSNENSDEDGEDDESQENSSEEKNKEQDRPQQEAPAAPSPPPRGPTVNVILHGRPSEELQGPPQQHNQDRPYPGDNTNGQQTSASNEDDLDSDEENANSNSAAMEATSKEISQEMAKIPNPARPPPPHHFRMNQSSEYTYSDENDGHRPGSMRPINYSYFNKPPRDQHNGGPPSPLPQGQQHHESQPPPQTSTQKYSTGFLSFLFGKDKKKQQNHPPPGSMENRPYQHQQQHQNQPPQNNSEEDPNDDDDGDDDDDSSEERNNRFDNPEFTAPDGKYEVGHLGNKQPPKAIKPNFSPPQKPQRPYRGSTSMEDSDEKRGRSTPAPTTAQTTTTTTPRPRPVIMYGNPFQTIIPAPATPPQRTPSPQPTTSLTTKKPKKESDEDDTASDEEKPSDESREDDEENSSEEVSKKNVPKTKITLVKTSNDKVKPVKTYAFPPIANYPGGGGSAETKAATPAPAPPMRQSTKTKSSSKNRADNEDVSDEKQDDSTEDNKDSKENDEESDEDKSSEEKVKKIPTRPPQKRRKPEDDELDNPNKYPPQLSVAGDIDAVEEILGAPEEENTNNEPEQYGIEEDIPAPPPLALQGFAPSLEIVVPTKAPVAPLKVPPGYPLHEFYQGTNPLSAGGAPPGGVGAPPPGPGAPLAPGPGQQQLAPAHPTSLLGLAQQANNGPNENPGAGQGSAPANQGLRNPLGQTSNRGPGQNNRRPGQQGQQNQQGQRGQQNNRRQQGNRNKQEGNEDSSEENSSEEKEGAKSSEEKEENSDEQEETKGPFDEAIESLGETGNDDDDDDKPEKDLKASPPPPPIFTGSKEQKQEVEKRKPFLPRPITPQTPLYLRPNPGRREPILKHQLQPTQLLQIQHPQRIRPPPQRPSPAQPSPSSPLVLPMRPSAAANLGPFKGQMRPTNQFSVSHLLRPLMPQRPVAHRKPLDPKVVQWIRDTYGIPEGIDPNRSGLQSQDVTGSGSTTTTKPPRKSSQGDKHNRTKDKLKASSKRKATTERTKVRGSAEKRNSGEVTNPPTTTTTSTTTTTAATTTTTSTAATTTTTLASTTKSTTPYSSLPPPTTTATSSTTVKAESKSPSLLNKKLPPDYITEEQEAIMAQKMFSSEEEPEEEEEKDSEEDSDEATTKKYKSKVKSKVGETKLVITIKSVPNNKDKTTSSSSGERAKVKSGEKGGKLPGRFGFTSAERKKLFLPISRDKLKSSSVENLSGEKTKKKYGSKSSEVSRRKSGSAEKVLKKKGSSSSTESKTKLSTTTLNPKFVLRLRSTPRPKPIKLPPIYGKRKHHIKRHG